jgi:hypothetical protein
MIYSPKEHSMRLRLWFGVFLLGAAGLMSNVSRTAAPPTYSQHVEQWGIQEVLLSSSKVYANPFVDVDLQAEFRAGQG